MLPACYTLSKNEHSRHWLLRSRCLHQGSACQRGVPRLCHQWPRTTWKNRPGNLQIHLCQLLACTAMVQIQKGGRTSDFHAVRGTHYIPSEIHKTREGPQPHAHHILSPPHLHFLARTLFAVHSDSMYIWWSNILTASKFTSHKHHFFLLLTALGIWHAGASSQCQCPGAKHHNVPTFFFLLEDHTTVLGREVSTPTHLWLIASLPYSSATLSMSWHSNGFLWESSSMSSS